MAAGCLKLKDIEHVSHLLNVGFNSAALFILEENVGNVIELKKDSLLPSRTRAGEVDTEERGQLCGS